MPSTKRNQSHNHKDAESSGIESGSNSLPTGSGRARRGGIVMNSQFPQQNVWYRLMKLTNLINRPFFTRFAERYELSINDTRVLMTLANMPELASHELCDATGMHPMNVSRSVAVLRGQGRLKEKRDPSNRRRKILTLTPEGWAVYRTFEPDLQNMADFLFASMTSREMETLSKLVDGLIHRLETVDPDNPLLHDSPVPPAEAPSAGA